MSFNYSATDSFVQNGLVEVEQFIKLAKSDDNNRQILLKASVVCLVTKFQVFIEGVLDEFYLQLKEMDIDKLSSYLQLNSAKISLDESEKILSGLQHTDKYSEKEKNKIVDCLSGLLEVFNRKSGKVGEQFKFNTKFKLGKMGTKELSKLFVQIDGNKAPFLEFGEEKIAKIDSLLQVRHLIVHQDRFSQTDITVSGYIDLVKEFADFVDRYLKNKIDEIKTTS